jgi:hypothetical protein
LRATTASRRRSAGVRGRLHDALLERGDVGPEHPRRLASGGRDGDEAPAPVVGMGAELHQAAGRELVEDHRHVVGAHRQALRDLPRLQRVGIVLGQGVEHPELDQGDVPLTAGQAVEDALQLRAEDDQLARRPGLGIRYGSWGRVHGASVRVESVPEPTILKCTAPRSGSPRPGSAVAAANGATHTINAKQTDPIEAIKELTDGRGADALIETISSNDSLTRALLAAATGARSPCSA